LASKGPRALFIDRYTISVIEKCEGIEGVIEEEAPNWPAART
jgi:hypothetical protein